MTPFEHPAHVPVAFTLAVWTIMHQAGSRENQVLAWEVLDRQPRRQALAWIKDVLAANNVPRLADELAWWGRQLHSADN
jgi:hypothetical protein